jgi:hypothetical protein
MSYLHFLSEYKRATGFSSNISKNGGVCSLVKDNISYQVLDLTNLIIETIFEACAVKITINKRKLCILCLYRSPDGDLIKFIEQLDSTLSYLERIKVELIICGDTNINYLIENYKKEQLQSVLDTYNLVQIISFPTRISSTSISLIDNFFLDRSIYNKFHVYPAINGLSDHDGQILILENLQAVMQSKHENAFREMNEGKIANFQLAVQNENWEEVYNQENVNRKFNIFLNIFFINF